MFVVCILSRVNTPAKFDFWQQFSQHFRLSGNLCLTLNTGFHSQPVFKGKHDVMKV